MKDVTKMKKAELLDLLSEVDSEVLQQAKSEKWTVAQLREWLNANLPEEDDDVRTLSSTMGEYRKKYEKTTDYAGKPTLTCGDDLAAALTKLAPHEVVELAEKVLGLEDGELWEKYQNLNSGQQRMCSGNRIRAAMKKGTITVKDVTSQITK